MRQIISLNDSWFFKKNEAAAPDQIPAWRPVTVPHCFNAFDGQDGGNDYFRGPCMYVREFWLPDTMNPAGHVYLEFCGVANVATVYVNGTRMTEHKGGFGGFRVDVTSVVKLDAPNLVAVCADNTNRTDVYPQTADFTFYGGLYRDVNLIVTEPTHFSLDFHGAPGLAVTAKPLAEGKASVKVQTWITAPESDDFVEITLCDAAGHLAAQRNVPASTAVEDTITLCDAHLWQGVEDPYLYTAVVRLVRHNEVLDEVSTRFGIREFSVDPEKGFFLNGKLMPLRGVCRHQDRVGQGNAITKEQHEEDVRIIAELGANTIRLAHYQHNQYFYDACDAAGLVVWAEIPFISRFSPDPLAHENCRSQMTELIYQNYNHACICFWGISNEITIGGDCEQLQINLRDLNELVHQLDPTRLSTMAQVSMVPIDSPHNFITDVVSYNIYYGWYGGELKNNEEWLDRFHAANPDRPLGISEYGADCAISFHSDNPMVRDYTEEYQAIYHEHMAKIIEERPWIWATHLWNMFDFGADARDEGGVKGRNNKGIVTMDRKIKKDAYYVYKAYWSKEPFVHIASRRYALRAYDSMTVKVYSNCPEVTLFVNGEKFAALEGEKVFLFENVPVSENTEVVAVSGSVSDNTVFHRVAEPYKPYFYEDPLSAAGKATVKNWFESVDPALLIEREYDPTCYSTRDTIGTLLDHEECLKVVGELLQSFSGPRRKGGATADMPEKEKEKAGPPLGMLKEMFGNNTIDKMLSMMGTMSGVRMTDEQMTQVMHYADTKLQKIKK